MGENIPALDPYVGQEVTINAEGIGTFQGKLNHGSFSYMVRGDQINLQLYPGSPVTVTAGDGTIIDMRKIQL